MCTKFHQESINTVIKVKEAPTSLLIKYYFKLLIRSRTTTQNIWFFNECLKHKVFPKYIKLKTDNRSLSAQKGKTWGMKKWLQEEKNIQYSKRDALKIHIFI